MKTVLKAAAWTVGSVIVLIVAAVIIIPLVIDPNDYKDEISAAVKDATGRELSFQGDLKLSVFPWLGVELGALELSNAEGFGPDAFAKVGGAAVKVQLLPLLKKEVRVATVTLDGLYVNLITDAQGRTNWADLAGAETPDETAEPAPEAAGPPLAALAIGGVRLRDATAIWDDRQTPARYEVSGLTLKTGEISPGQPVDVDLKTQLKSSEPAVSGEITLTTRAHLDEKFESLRLENLIFTSQLGGAGLPADDIRLELTSDIDADLSGPRVTLPNLQFSAQLRGKELPAEEINLSLSSRAELDVAAERYLLKGLRITNQMRGKDLPGGKVDATLASDLSVDLAQQTLSLETLTLEALGIKASGQVLGQQIIDQPRFKGTLATTPFNARDLLLQLSGEPLETADPNALTAVSADLAFDATLEQAQLSKLALNLDQTKLSGSAGIRNFEQPAITFKLAVDDIDADRYLAPPAKEPAATPAPTTPGQAAAGAADLPMDTLRSLDVDGSLSIGKLKVSNMRMADITAAVRAKDGVIRVHPVGAKMYGGAYKGDIKLDARGEQPVISMDETLSDIDIGALTQDFLAKDLVSGAGNLRLKLSARGIDPEAVLRSLSGDVGFAFLNGGVKGFNLVESVKADYAKHLQGLLSDGAQLDKTMFSKFSANATVTDGAIRTEDLALSSAQLDVKGRGGASLVDQKLDLRIDLTPRGQFAKDLGKFKDVVVPVTVRGTFYEPKISTNLDDALKQAAKARLGEEKAKLEAKLQAEKDQAEAKLQQELDAKKREAEQKVEKKREELKGKVEEELQDKLKGLFK